MNFNSSATHKNKGSSIFVRDLFINKIAASKITPKRIRMFLYKRWGLEIEGGISPGSFIGGHDIKIGRNSFVNYNCFFDGLAPIKIGKNCFIAMEVMFCTSTHKIQTENGEKRIGDSYGLPITVEDNCWIGARATILPGVTVGKGCIIAAGAVVAKDCAPDGFYAGVPAKRIKDI